MAIFGNNKDQQQQVEMGTASANTHLAKGAFFKGDFETFGTIRLEGKVLGNLTSRGKISIADGALLEGNLLAQSAEIAGEVRGKVEIVDVLTLKSTAVINGNITCNKLVIESGANFNGKCQMGSNLIKEIPMGELAKNAFKSDGLKSTSDKSMKKDKPNEVSNMSGDEVNLKES
jgi:cytoskeletal protein CcmA (bactofilin family)